MGLPDLIKQSFGEEKTRPVREGFSLSGSPQTRDLKATALNAFARRIALKRPTIDDLRVAEENITALEQTENTQEQLDNAILQRDEILRRRSRIPFIDPVDEEFRRFVQKPAPSAQAVMFCMMDVSGSMDEFMKDLAKRFFMLLRIFLKKRYKRVDLVFIRHTHQAREVDEDIFFNDPETGGTIVSTALECMQKSIKEKYPPSLWNIYGAQISDGENFDEDNKRCLELLTQGPNAILPNSQYFAYVEVENPQQRKRWAEFMRRMGAAEAETKRQDTNLWVAYKALLDTYPNFAMQHARAKEDIWLVFKKLFQKDAVRSTPKAAAVLNFG